MLKICVNGHLCGTRRCGTCDCIAHNAKPGHTWQHAGMSRKYKRWVSTAIRREGVVPVDDLRRRFVR